MSTTISTLDTNKINFIYKNINLEKNNILNEINSYTQIKKIIIIITVNMN